MNQHRLLFSILLLTILSSCRSDPSIPASPARLLAADRNEIRKLALMDSLSRISAKERGPIFVAIEGYVDPSPDLLEQLHAINSNVRPYSACKLDGVAIDTSTKEQGLGLFLNSVRFATATSAYAETWLFSSMRAGYGMQYQLELLAGQWCIVQCKHGPVA